MGHDAAVALIGAVVGAAITATVQWVNSERDRRHRLRTTAIDKRLAVHQEAYSLWRKIKAAANKPDGQDIGAVVIECQNWWENNCLYLDPSVREAFRKCYQNALDRPHMLREHFPASDITANWNIIKPVGSLIEKAVGLPSIGDLEEK
jgi:hypothetical protein